MELGERLVLLVAELLDAHDDTVRLSEAPVLGWRWQEHLGYLRDLQRLGRETLAAAAADAASVPTPSAGMRSARPRSCPMTYGAGVASRFRSSFLRRGDRRCARYGHGEGPA
jgi:hypothetical protein